MQEKIRACVEEQMVIEKLKLQEKIEELIKVNKEQESWILSQMGTLKQVGSMKMEHEEGQMED
jgi:hypothetical protein